RQEVGVAAVGLAHHPVLVVAEVGGAQPQRAAFLVGVALGDQRTHGFLDLAVGVKRRFQVIGVERHAERGQVGVLLAAQVGDGELAYRIEVVGVILAVDGVAFHFDAVAAQVGG